MRVSYQWLSEYVDLNGYSASDLAEKLTRSGVEVDVVEKRNQGVTGVVTGEVIACEPHPNADKLRVCTVDVGQEETLNIVCGASNVAAGQKVPVALVGAVLPGNFKIKKAKLRGVESRGMICSARELGLNDRLLPKELQEGILVLPPETETGQDIIPLLGLDDEVLELDLTPNRSDCLSMIGTAYEIAAILGREIRLPEPEKGISESDVQASEQIRVSIEAPEHCRHYAARLVENITVGPSPLWMQNRLIAAGIRPINNVVDITNYVMLEYGQPLHAFDADRLEGGEIRVRLARNGESMVTLDDTERKLDETMLVIADAAKPVAVAGVMGGADTEVTERTARVLLESANFRGTTVRLASKKLGLRSESSLRFEKEADPGSVIPAINRAAELLARYADGQVARGIVEDHPVSPEPAVISLHLDQVNEILGTDMTGDNVADILQRLKFSFQCDDGKQFRVEVPSRRGDITREVDLVEEVARLYGYDCIPTTLLGGVTTPGRLTREQQLRRSVRNWLLGQGLHETISYSFTDPQKIGQFSGLFDDARPIPLSMPMSEERSVLRTSLIPHLVDTAVYNRNRNEEDVAIFEIGRVFVTDESRLTRQPEEIELLSLLMTGRRSATNWTGTGEKVDFYEIKGIAEALFDFLGMRDIRYVPAQPKGFHPGRTAEIVCRTQDGEARLGRIGQIHPELAQQKDLDETYVMELELAPLYRLSAADVTYRPLPKYPAVGRDLAVVVKEEVPAGDMLSVIQRTGGSLLESAGVFDVYRGENIEENCKSVAFSLLYRHEDRTLTDEEVNQVHGEIVRALETGFAAKLRES